MKKTIIILSHPNFNASKYNQALIDGVKNMDGVTVRHLESLYGEDASKIDVKVEQEELIKYERVIFQFPFYWYGIPGFMKSWIDKVFEYGFAFGSNGDKLHDKEFKAVTTIGAVADAYEAGGFNKFTISELLKPLFKTADLAGMVSTRTFAVHGCAFELSKKELEAEVKRYQDVLKDEDYDWGGGLNRPKRVLTKLNFED